MYISLQIALRHLTAEALVGQSALLKLLSRPVAHVYVAMWDRAATTIQNASVSSMRSNLIGS